MNKHSRGPQPELTTRGHPLPKGDPWLVYVDVYLKKVTPKLEFEISSCLPTHKRPYKGKEEDYLVFDNNGRKGFKIRFQLHDETGRGYRFPDVESDAVWSQKGDCPHTPQHDVFKNPNVMTDDRTTVEVFFRNDTDSAGNPVGDFRYTLNVTTDGNLPYLELDPGGTGNNGQTFR